MDPEIGDDSENETFSGPVKSLSVVPKAIMSPSSFPYGESDSDLRVKIIEKKSDPVLVSDATTTECSLNAHHDKNEHSLHCNISNTHKKKLSILTRQRCVRSSSAEIFSPKVVQELVIDKSPAMKKFDSVIEIASSPETDPSSSNESVDLDNTFEQVEFMLLMAEKMKHQSSKNEVQGSHGSEYNSSFNVKTSESKTLQATEIKTPVFETPLKSSLELPKTGSHLPFKTPPSLKNILKSNASRFPNIVSPIKYCITNSQEVPQIQNVRPKKAMGLPALPTPRSDVPKTLEGKENIFLPAVAYKAAKETKLINQTPATGLPNNKQVNKMVSALPQPTVVRHVRREMISGSKHLSPIVESGQTHKVTQIDDSFADLPNVSADVSICIKKTAARTDNLKSKH